MADWDRTYIYPSPPDPPVGSYYAVNVNKPAGWKKVSVTGTGRETDPWIITYAAADPVLYPAKPADKANMSIRVAGKPTRSAYLKVIYDGTPTTTDRPIVRDIYSGGAKAPKPPKKAGKKASAKAGKKKSAKASSKSSSLSRSASTRKKAPKKSARSTADKKRSTKKKTK